MSKKDSDVEIGKIRRKYKILSDPSRVSDLKITDVIEESTIVAKMAGLEGNVLTLGVRHLATYKLLLDVGMIKSKRQKEESEEKFDTDPAKQELNLYNKLVADNNKDKGTGSSFCHFFGS